MAFLTKSGKSQIMSASHYNDHSALMNEVRNYEMSKLIWPLFNCFVIQKLMRSDIFNVQVNMAIADC